MKMKKKLAALFWQRYIFLANASYIVVKMIHNIAQLKKQKKRSNTNSANNEKPTANETSNTNASPVSGVLYPFSFVNLS